MVKVLAIKDGNFQTIFITEEAEIFYNAKHFMKEALLEPHGAKYEVRFITKAHQPADFQHLNQSEWKNLFDSVYLTINHKILELDTKNDIFVQNFSSLWKAGDEDFDV